MFFLREVLIKDNTQKHCFLSSFDTTITYFQSKIKSLPFLHGLENHTFRFVSFKSPSYKVLLRKSTLLWEKNMFVSSAKRIDSKTLEASHHWYKSEKSKALVSSLEGTVMAQWSENSRRTSVARVRFPGFVGSQLCTERFFSGYSCFSLSSKSNICFDLR